MLKQLGLIPAGGNYAQVNKRIVELGLNMEHFTGKGWNVGMKKFNPRPRLMSLEEIMVEKNSYQRHKLKKILFTKGIKEQKCELCGWAEQSIDGRIPVELDHINGNHSDNRLQNLRILCPNCHSLQLTHRGRNKKVAFARVLE